MCRRKIHVVDQALATIKDEAERWKNQDKECGGAVLTAIIKESPVILYALRTGPRASQSHSGLTTDHVYQSEMFQRILGFYPAMRGPLKAGSDWHLHPMYLPELSMTDHHQCRRNLQDELYDLDELPIILVTYRDEEEVICPFLVSLDGHGQVVVEDAELEIVSSDAPLVEEFLQADYVSVDTIARIYELEEKASKRALSDLVLRSFYETPFGKTLIESEKAELAELIGSDPVLSYLEEAKVLCMTFGYEGYDFRIVYPPEYPLNGPTGLCRVNGAEDFQEIKWPFPWNSLCSAYSIVKDLIKSIPPRKEVNEDEDSREATQAKETAEAATAVGRPVRKKQTEGATAKRTPC